MPRHNARQPALREKLERLRHDAGHARFDHALRILEKSAPMDKGDNANIVGAVRYLLRSDEFTDTGSARRGLRSAAIPSLAAKALDAIPAILAKLDAGVPERHVVLNPLHERILDALRKNPNGLGTARLAKALEPYKSSGGLNTHLNRLARHGHVEYDEYRRAWRLAPAAGDE